MKTILTYKFGWFLIFLSLGPITFGCSSSKEITLLEEAGGKEIHVYAREGWKT